MPKNIRQKIGKSTLSTISAMDIDPDLLEEMEANPLSYNPFFASNMANRFEGEGKEGIDSGMLSLLRRKWMEAFPPLKIRNHQFVLSFLVLQNTSLLRIHMQDAGESRVRRLRAAMRRSGRHRLYRILPGRSYSKGRPCSFSYFDVLFFVSQRKTSSRTCSLKCKTRRSWHSSHFSPLS